MEQKQHGMTQRQHQGPDRRQSQEQDRRKSGGYPGMGTQQRKDEQEERARQQSKSQDDRL